MSRRISLTSLLTELNIDQTRTFLSIGSDAFTNLMKSNSSIFPVDQYIEWLRVSVEFPEKKFTLSEKKLELVPKLKTLKPVPLISSTTTFSNPNLPSDIKTFLEEKGIDIMVSMVGEYKDVFLGSFSPSGSIPRKQMISFNILSPEVVKYYRDEFRGGSFPLRSWEDIFQLLYEIIVSKKGVIVHELQHAFDRWRSNDKYLDVRQGEYLRLRDEYHTLPSDRRKTADSILRNLKYSLSHEIWSHTQQELILFLSKSDDEILHLHSDRTSRLNALHQFTDNIFGLNSLNADGTYPSPPSEDMRRRIYKVFFQALNKRVEEILSNVNISKNN